jgi:MraZ protein
MCLSIQKFFIHILFVICENSFDKLCHIMHPDGDKWGKTPALVSDWGLSMFIGEYRPVVDDRGRLAVPMKLRKAFGDELISKLIVAPGFDRCVMAFRMEEWESFVKSKVLALSQDNPENRKKVRFIMGGASECELDKQGRILIPPQLKDFAEIEKETVIIGVFDRVEVWCASRYEEYRPSLDTIDNFASEMGM